MDHIETRAQALRASSVDDEKRTVELVWTAGATVRRFGWFADYDEELVVSDEAVNLTRLQNGAPLLDSHNARGLDSILGVHESVSIDDGKGVATVRFSEQPQGERAFAMVREGTAGKVSTGYAIDAYERIKAKDRTDGDQSVDLYRITRWTPHENSLVPIPADDEPGMGVRAARASLTVEDRDAVAAGLSERFDGDEMLIRRNVRSWQAAGEPMSLRAAFGASAAPDANELPEPATEPEPNDNAARAAVQEQPEMSEENKAPAVDLRAGFAGGVLAAAKACGLDASDDRIASILTNEDLTTDQARSAVIELGVAKADEAGIRAAHSVEVGTEEIDKERGEIRDVLLARGNVGKVQMPQGSDYSGRSLLSIGRRFAQRRGLPFADGRDAEVARGLLKRGGGHTTSDFAHILADVAHNSLEAGYEETERTFLTLGRRKDLPDFRVDKMSRISDLPEMTKVNESGEYESMSLTDSGESWQVYRRGGRVDVSFELIVNDNLGALTDIPQHAGAAGARVENNVFWSAVTDNAAMSDGIALFHADHGANLRSAAAFGKASLADMYTAMMKQTGPKGSKLRLRLGTVAIPVALWGAAQELKATGMIARTPAEVIPAYISALDFVAEPRLDDVSTTAFYGFATDNRYGLVYGHLAGESAVAVESEIDFATDGLAIKFRHIFGTGVSEYRGLAKNPGA